MTSTARAERRDFAATLRSAAGEVLGTTHAATICWFPRKPSMLAAVARSGDAEHVLRCGWCPGCLELDRRRLARRIDALFKEVERVLWLVVVECPLSEQSRLVSRLRRRATVKWLSGFFRISATAVALIAAAPKPRLRVSSSRSACSVHCWKIRRSRGLRAWDLVTAGMLRNRDEWGEQTKRYYSRGLPAAEREAFQVATRGGLTRRHPGFAPGIRGFRRGVGLYPPEAWRPPRLNKRHGPVDRRTSQPQAIATAVADVYSRLMHQPPVRRTPVIARAAKPCAAESVSLVDAPRGADRTERADPNSSSGRRYTSSLQTEIDAWLARMLKAGRGRSP